MQNLCRKGTSLCHKPKQIAPKEENKIAQTQVVTNEGYALIAGYLSGATGADTIKSIVALTDCTGGAQATKAYASLAKSTESGLTIQDATAVTVTSTSVAGDTVQLDDVLTAGATDTIAGIAVCNDDDNAAHGYCCFDASVALATADTITFQWKESFGT